MIYNNYESLIGACNAGIKRAAEEVADKLLEELKLSIENNVYRAYTPTNENHYERTGQFKDSWKYDLSDGLNTTIIQISQDYTKMVFNPDKWQHGSPEEWTLSNGRTIQVIGAGDAREELASHIEYGVTAGFWGDFPARSFWTPWLKQIEAGRYDKIILQALRNQGFHVNKGNRFKTGLHIDF